MQVGDNESIMTRLLTLDHRPHPLEFVPIINFIPSAVRAVTGTHIQIPTGERNPADNPGYESEDDYDHQENLIRGMKVVFIDPIVSFAETAISFGETAVYLLSLPFTNHNDNANG